MHALRLHKGRGPGRDKAREIRKLQQVTRQREARGTLLQGLRSFLSADSFMYGPLLESPPTVTTLSDDSEPHTPDRKQEKGGFDDDSSRDYLHGEENDTNSGKDVDNGHDESLLRRNRGSRSNSKTVVSVLHTSAQLTARTVLPPADGSHTPSSTAQVPKAPRNGT